MGVDRLIAERLQLTDDERREQGLVGVARGYDDEQRLAAGGITRESGDSVAQLLGRENGETAQQHGRGIFVADRGESLDQSTTEGRRGLLGEDLVDHRRGGAIARGDEHGERALTGGQGGFLIGEVSAVIGAAGFIAGEGVELVEVGQEIGRSTLAETRDQHGPAFRGGERTGLTDPFDHAAHQRRATGGIGLA